MSTQSEAVLEDSLIKRLSNNGYEFVKIKNEEELNANFKIQLEKLNKKELKDNEISNAEFDRILTYLDSGSIFDKADKLRDTYRLKRERGKSVSIKSVII